MFLIDGVGQSDACVFFITTQLQLSQKISVYIDGADDELKRKRFRSP